jgi:hypothetical protein
MGWCTVCTWAGLPAYVARRPVKSAFAAQSRLLPKYCTLVPGMLKESNSNMRPEASKQSKRKQHDKQESALHCTAALTMHSRQCQAASLSASPFRHVGRVSVGKLEQVRRNSDNLTCHANRWSTPIDNKILLPFVHNRIKDVGALKKYIKK